MNLHVSAELSPAAQLPPPGASEQATETGLLVTRPASQRGEGLERMDSRTLSVFLADLEGAGWGPEAGQVGTRR